MAGWIQAGGDDQGRGKRLLGEIQYGLLTASRLAEVGLRAEEMVGDGLGCSGEGDAGAAEAACGGTGGLATVQKSLRAT